MDERIGTKPSGSNCRYCNSKLMNADDGWPAPNESKCIGPYHDGGYGSDWVPGYCGIRKQKYYR